MTYPAVGSTPSEQPWQPLVGTWKFDLEQSEAGGVMHILQHYESAGAWRWPFDLTATAARAAWQPAE